MDSSFSTYYAVTGSQKPYIFDLPKVISLPVGSEFRFRYRPKWVQKEIRESLDSNGNDVIGSTIVILFHSQQRKSLIPLRKARIIDAKSIGPMIFLRFHLGEFNAIDIDDSLVPYNSSSEVDQILYKQNEYGQKITGPIGGDLQYNLSKPLPEEWYVRKVASDLNLNTWHSTDDSKAWASIAAILHSEPNLSGVPFFYIKGFEDESGNNIKPSELKNSFFTKKKINGFKMVEGNRYRLDVVEWCEPLNPSSPLPNVEVNCEPNGDSLALEGASNIVVGRYDVLEFSLVAQKPGLCEVSISASPSNFAISQENNQKANAEAEGDDSKAKHTEEWATWPSIFVARLKIKVIRSKKRMCVIGLMGLIGISAYYFGPNIASGSAKEGIQLFGLFLALTAFGEFTKSMVKMREHITKISQQTKAPQP